MKKSPSTIDNRFYKPIRKVQSEPSLAELEKQRQAEIERMIEAKVAQALRCLKC